MTTKQELYHSVRASLSEIPEEAAHHPIKPPRLEDIYVVPGHEGALNPENTVVVGDRGSGKSFWSAALNGDETRHYIAIQFQRLRLDQCSVSWGFSTQRVSKNHPSRQVLNRLVADGIEPESIWRTVVLSQLLPLIDVDLPGSDWYESTQYVEAHPEQEEAWLDEVDQHLQAQGKRHLVVFDALERLGDDWASIRHRLKALLRVCLDLREFSAIRAKLFMRPDMWEDQFIWAFPDASKLHHGRVLLEWRPVDLYGLLWHWLANRHPDHSRTFRQWCTEQHGYTFDALAGQDDETIHGLPQKLRADEQAQAAVLHDIASRYMGTNRRRGKTYSWLTTHLADAKGKVSPRSFLVAVKSAQKASSERGAETVLHYDGIKKGVSDASRIRRQELSEDYRWIVEVFKPLEGLTVPVTTSELIERWRENDVLARIEQPPAPEDDDDDKSYLPPHAMDNLSDEDEREEALIQSLIEIGVMNRIPDGRINIPDLFRVAVGIGRRGGVKAIR